MDTKETLQAIDDQIENLKLHADIVVSTKLSGFKQIPEHDFEVLKGKVNSKVYNLVVWNATGGMYKAFDFVAPKTQKQMKNVIQWSPYIAAIIATLFGVLQGTYILALSLLIPFISGFVTGIVKPGLINMLILGGLSFYFLLSEDIVGFLFMCVWVISFLLFGVLRTYIKSVLIELSLLDEKIFSFLYHSRYLRIYDLKNDKWFYAE